MFKCFLLVGTYWDNVYKDLYLPAIWHLHFDTLIPALHSFCLGYVGEYRCTVIDLCLLLYLQFLSRLRRRIQVYCDQSLFATLSTVSRQAT